MPYTYSKAYEARVQAEYKAIIKKIASCGTAAAISIALAMFLPWNALGAGINIAMLIKHCSELRRLKQKSPGIDPHVGGSDIMMGICQAVLIKSATTILTLGHDDLFGAACQADSFFEMAGNWIAEHHIPVHIDHSAVTSVIRDILDWDSAHRMSHSLIEHTTHLASAPVEAVQGVLDIDKALDQFYTFTGWHAPAGTLAKQVFLAGGVQALTEWAIEKFVEEPIGLVSERGRALCQKKKEGIAQRLSHMASTSALVLVEKLT